MAFRIFHISIFAFLVVVYGLLVYYIIPEFVEDDKKAIASSYSGYALGICGSLLTIGSMLTDYIDKRNDIKTQIKGAKR